MSRARRWCAAAGLALLAALVALGAAACPASHGDYPTASCKIDSDCYQGETCMRSGETGTCVAGAGSPDGGAP